MDQLLEFAGKLGEVGFPTLLVLILYGSYKGVWVWGSTLQKAEAAWATALAKAEAEAAGWKGIALQGLGLAETSVSIAKTTRAT